MKAAIFDMDGTILDSMREWDALGVNHLESLGVTPPEGLREALKEMSVEESSDYFMKEFGLWKTKEELSNQWREQIHLMYEHRVQLKPYVFEYFQQLKRKEIKMCIATATPADYAVAALKRLEVLDFCEFVLCEDDVKADKRQPKIYLEAARRLDYEPSRIVVFEDALYAARSAKEGGFKLYGVYDKSFENDKEQLLKICDKYIVSFQDLLEG